MSFAQFNPSDRTGPFGRSSPGESEQRLAFLLTLNDALRPLNDPINVQEVAARLTGEHLGVNRVGYAEMEGGKYVIRREYVRGVPPLTREGLRAGFGEALRDAYRQGETVVVNDVGTDPRFTEPERIVMEGRQIAAFIGVPLLKGGRMVAAFGANHATPRVWTPVEIELVRDVAERTWDAVERARAESALREREHRLQLALDASQAGSWTWDTATNCIDGDLVFRARYGFSPEETLTFDGWLARVLQEDRPQVLAYLDEVLQAKTRSTWDYSFRIVRPDGTMLWMQCIGLATQDVDGQIIRLTGLEMDVTDRRRAEEELQARRDEEHDRELRLLVETAAQGIVSVDARGTIVMANGALESMFGWESGELIGQPIERLVPGSLRNVHAQHRSAYFHSPRPRPMVADVEFAGQRKDGSTFPIEVNLNHVPTSSGGRAIAFVTDITERQRAAAELRKRTVELERRTAQLSQMASDLTLAEQHAREQLAKTLHDGLQQLLLIAAMKLDQLAKRESSPGVSDDLFVEAKSHLDEAIAAARSLSFELFPPVLQSLGLPAALSWLADWTQSKYGLEVQICADPDANSGRKDVRTLLFESVRELLFNAVKHAHVDRVQVDLVVDSHGMLCITVADEGIGFDPARLAQSQAGHVGWGLFSIRERLMLLGGRLEVNSAPGQGTRFRLIAPLGPAQDLVAAEDSSSRRTPNHAAAGTGPAYALRILIVDDHPAVRKVIREMLERPELRIVGDAADGFEAIEQAHMLRPDVVLMDISMPRMDGVEATRRVRAELPFIQILGLSSQSHVEGLHPIEQAGAAGFFVKGEDTDRLMDHLLAIHAAITPRLPDQPT